MYFNNDNLPYGDGTSCNNCLPEDLDFYSNEYYGFPYYDGIASDAIEIDTNSYCPQQQPTTMAMDGDGSNLILAPGPDSNCSYVSNSIFMGAMDNNATQAEVIEDTTPRKRSLENDIEMFSGCYPLSCMPNDSANDSASMSVVTADIPNLPVSTPKEGVDQQDQQHQKAGQAVPVGPKRNKSGGRTRVAAHEFRQKQKLYIYSLEKRVAELTAVNTEMQSRLHLMSNENNIIKEHLAYLRGFIAQAVPPSNLPEQDPSASSSTSNSSSSSSTSIITMP